MGSPPKGCPECPQAAGKAMMPSDHNKRNWGFPKIRGTLFEGPHNKNFSISGSILGFPYFEKLPTPLRQSAELEEKSVQLCCNKCYIVWPLSQYSPPEVDR